jgi:hypothetical protein
MSDFFDSYHPVADVQSAVALVRRARRDGLVIPEQAPYTCVLIDQPDAGTDDGLVAANDGLLVVYQYAEDHGVNIELYDHACMTARLALEWGPDFLGEFAEGKPRAQFDPAPWIAAGLLDATRAASIQRLADTVAEGPAPHTGYEAARLLGLTRFEHLSCDPAVRGRPWGRVVDRVLERFPDAIEIDAS